MQFVFPEEITLVCLGPLTNLALALRLDPLEAIKEVVVVGGNIEGNEFSLNKRFFLVNEAYVYKCWEREKLIVLPISRHLSEI